MEKPHNVYRQELAEKLRELRNDEIQDTEFAHARARAYLDVEQETPQYKEAREEHLVEARDVQKNAKRERLLVEGPEILKEVFDPEVVDRMSAASEKLRKIGFPCWEGNYIVGAVRRSQENGAPIIPEECDINAICAEVKTLFNEFEVVEQQFFNMLGRLDKGVAADFSKRHPDMKLTYDPNWFSHTAEPLERAVFGLMTMYEWQHLLKEESARGNETLHAWKDFCGRYPATEESKAAWVSESAKIRIDAKRRELEHTLARQVEDVSLLQKEMQQLQDRLQKAEEGRSATEERISALNSELQDL